MTTRSLCAAWILCVLAAAAPMAAAEFERTYDFAMDSWMEIDAGDGPIVLHRIRLDRIEGRLTKSALARPYNSEYLETVRVQLDYTNNSSSKWSARLTVRWMDEAGTVIDGISANEKLDKNSARKVAQLSLSTLKYGLDRAAKLQVVVHFEP